MASQSPTYLASKIYGEIAYWLAIVGVAISLVGCIILLTHYHENATCTLSALIKGDPPHEILASCLQITSFNIKYVIKAGKTIGLQLDLIGLFIFGLAVTISIVIASGFMLKDRVISYGIISIVLALILILSMLGLITVYL